MATDFEKLARHVGRVEMSRSGHALERNVIDIAVRQRCDRRDARFRRRRRQQEDRRDVARAQELRELAGLLRRIVDDEHTVDACRRGTVGEHGLAHRLDRVRVTHQHDRRRAIACAKIANEREYVGESDVLGKRPLGRALDYRAVRHRIRERNAQLDHVGAGRGQRVEQRRHGCERRIAGGDVRNQRGAARCLQLRECGVDAVQSCGAHLRCQDVSAVCPDRNRAGSRT